MREFSRISPEEWDRYQATSTPKQDEWAPVLDAVAGGDIVRLPYENDKELRGMRIALGRRASQRGMKLEYRSDESSVAVRRVAMPLLANGTSTRRRRRTSAEDAASNA